MPTCNFEYWHSHARKVNKYLTDGWVSWTHGHAQVKGSGAYGAKLCDVDTPIHRRGDGPIVDL